MLWEAIQKARISGQAEYRCNIFHPNAARFVGIAYEQIVLQGV